LPTLGPGSSMTAPGMAGRTAPASAKFMLQFVFCAGPRALVGGTMLERTKFIVYILFGVPFAAVIYPLISHWLFGGGWLQTTFGAQDFAGSTVVHLTGATAGLAGLLLLGPRIGKYGRRRAPNIIPGHNMPLAQLGVLILWFGWFGFNPGSTLNATNLPFADVVITTQMAAAAGAPKRTTAHRGGKMGARLLIKMAGWREASGDLITNPANRQPADCSASAPVYCSGVPATVSVWTAVFWKIVPRVSVPK